MASFGNQLSFFLLLVLVISPQIQAREGKLFSLFTHFRTIYNVKDPQAESPALVPTLEPVTAPTPEPVTAPTPAPSTSQAIGSTIPSGPAPEPEFFDSGEGYGLYGRGSYSQYPPTKETPTTTTFENKLLNEDFNDESYKTGNPKTNFYSNYNSEEYRNNDNTNEEYRNSYIGGYSNNFNDRYSNNNHNGKENYNNNYNGKENYYYNNNYNGIGYERKREGMSDTRFMENGRYYSSVNNDNENYNLNGYESGRGKH
ncbi:TBC1 domain family member 5-like A [Spatholobus suberectus]|nr:TBC1 domain family member 5-like A [Spatholobus suberectus]